jgi:hypothetical protein
MAFFLLRGPWPEPYLGQPGPEGKAYALRRPAPPRLYDLDSLAAAGAYRAASTTGPIGRALGINQKRKRFIVREDRMFLRLVSGAPAGRVAP